MTFHKLYFNFFYSSVKLSGTRTEFLVRLFTYSDLRSTATMSTSKSELKTFLFSLMISDCVSIFVLVVCQCLLEGGWIFLVLFLSSFYFLALSCIFVVLSMLLVAAHI